MPMVQCKHDFKVIISVHLILVVFLGIAGYDQIGVWSQNFVNWFFIKYLTLIFIYIGWSMWPYAIALIAIAAYICLYHYWNCIFVSWITLSTLCTFIGLHQYREMSITMQWFLEGLATAALIHLPVFFLSAGLIYFARKRKRIDSFIYK